MTFAFFLQICFKNLAFKGDTRFKYEFVPHFCALFMREPESEEDEELDSKDLYYPFANSRKAFLQKIFRGDERVPCNDAAKILRNYDATQFTDAVFNLPPESVETLKNDFLGNGITFGESDVGEILASKFKEIIDGLAAGKDETNDLTVPSVDARGRSIDEVNPAGVYLDKTAHKLIVGKEKIDVEYIPITDEIQPKEQKYIAALLSAYADMKGVDSLSISQLQKDYTFLYEDLNNNRKYFFDAASVYRCIRDAFFEGDKEFNLLKDEAYEGIREVYCQEYQNGYFRLNGVLSKITSTTLNRTQLCKFSRLIGNSEKKGLCHMLVEDGRINTWVIHF